MKLNIFCIPLQKSPSSTSRCDCYRTASIKYFTFQTEIHCVWWAQKQALINLNTNNLTRMKQPSSNQSRIFISSFQKQAEKSLTVNSDWDPDSDEKCKPQKQLGYTNTDQWQGLNLKGFQMGSYFSRTGLCVVCCHNIKQQIHTLG